MLKTDLHVHTNYSSDCLTTLDKLIYCCQKKEVQCVAVTDHNQIEGALLLQERAPFKVIVGEEIRTDRGEIIGYFLNRMIKPGMSPAKTVAEIKHQGGLVCVPHPFDRLRTSRLDHQALLEIAKEIDIIEGYNARNVYSNDNEQAMDFARHQKIAVSVGSDAHWPWEIGRTHMLIPDFSDAASFKMALHSLAYEISGNLQKSGLLVHLCTKTLKTVRKIRFTG